MAKLSTIKTIKLSSVKAAKISTIHSTRRLDVIQDYVFFLQAKARISAYFNFDNSKSHN